MDNYSSSGCPLNESNTRNYPITLSLLDLEHGSVIHSPKNETSFWTIFTFAWSSVGIALSAAALALLILTAVLFAEWRKNYKNQQLIQFMLARFLYTSVRFFADIQYMFQICAISERSVFLDILAVIYSELVLIAWMFVFSRQIYIGLVKVFTTENANIWTVSLCAWLGPAVAALLLNLLFYAGHDTNHRYLLIYILLVKWPILISNAVLLIKALRSVLKNNMNPENNTKIVIVMIILIFTFCFQQMVLDICKIAFFKLTLRKTVISIVLTVSNIISMYHCAFSVVFWVLGNANTRKLWRFRGKELRGKIRVSVRISALSSQK
uniref:G-protein coupled receptors family 2 profile 2 domain-containing protein n=1 Tax=Heliothis virescens TaxID=7102 RepID=A0A2A4JT21_HELVI